MSAEQKDTAAWLIGRAGDGSGILLQVSNLTIGEMMTLTLPPEEAELLAMQLLGLVKFHPTADVPAEDAFEEGWNLASRWANRDDMLHDTGSVAYQKERDAALAARQAKGGAA